MKIILATGIYPPEIGGPATYVERLAKRLSERGARVVITGRDAQTLQQTAREISVGSHPVEYVVCDVAQSAEIPVMVESVIARLGLRK